ncbi:MAG: hypothetical protein HY870_18520 [Chloroflexi bacterium]|nr:hypothetical protein [Chloroflexota bacterium]
MNTTDFFDELAAYLMAHNIPYQRRDSRHAPADKADLTIAWRAPLLFGLGSVTHDYAFYDLDRLTTPVTDRADRLDRAAYLRDLHARHRQTINARFKTPRAFRLHIPDVVTIAVAAEFDRACHDLALTPVYSMLGGEAHLLILLALRSATVITRSPSPRYELHPARARDFVQQIVRELLSA